MAFKKVVAIFDEQRLEAVKTNLIKHDVTGFTVYEVHDRGKYFDAIDEKRLIKYIQLHTYTIAEHAEKIAKLIVETVHVNANAEGLVVARVVDGLYWIHTKQPSKVEGQRFHGGN